MSEGPEIQVLNKIARLTPDGWKCDDPVIQGLLEADRLLTPMGYAPCVPNEVARRGADLFQGKVLRLIEIEPDDTEILPNYGKDRAITEKGGPGSGNYQHAGRPGKVGGSAPGSKMRTLAGSLDAEWESLGKFEPTEYALANYSPEFLAGMGRDYQKNAMNKLREVVKRKGYLVKEGGWITLNDMPDAKIVAEVINGLPPALSTANQIHIDIHDKDLQEGAVAFGSSGIYEPPWQLSEGINPVEGSLTLSIQSSDSPARKAWAVAHEFGHSYSIRRAPALSLAVGNKELLGLLGYGDPETDPEAFAKEGVGHGIVPVGWPKDGVQNGLRKYCKGPEYFSQRKGPGKAPWTRYGWTHPDEAFAEAFAGYMITPKALRRDRPALYNWMKSHVFRGVEYTGYADEPVSVVK